VGGGVEGGGVVSEREAPLEVEEQGAWGRPVAVRLGEIAMAVALLATAVFFTWQSALLPMGHIGLPGPGFFPFALGIALALLALAILYVAWRMRDGDSVYLGHRDVLVVFAALVGVALTFEWLGAYVSLGALTAGLLIFVGRASLWRVALGTVLGMAAVWVVFKVLLGVQLPNGPF
jgi:hypothetical protein